MKNIIIVTEENINLFSPYQGNDQYLKTGDQVQIATANVPCVWKQKGLKDTFSIYCGQLVKRYKDAGETNLTAYTWMYNRFSINDKLTK